MPIYQYKTLRDGQPVEGKVEAKDKFSLIEDLKKSGQEVIFVREASSKSGWDWQKINEIVVSVGLREKIMFARNLAAMIDAGISLSRALSILERQTKNLKFKRTLVALQTGVGSGGNLSSEMKKFPRIFPPIFISMVHAGEESGGLTEALRIVAGQLEKSYNLRRKIRGAMIYPAIVITAMIVIGILMFIFVVPTLTSTFKELDADLPASTQLIIATSDFLSGHTVLALSLMVSVVLLALLFAHTRKGKRMIHFSVLHIPVIGNLVRETNAAYTARTLASLLSSGAEVVESLKITQDVVPNLYFKDVLGKGCADTQSVCRK